MKKCIYVLLMPLLLLACRPVKRVQKIETAVTARDTSTRVVMPEKKPLDSLGMAGDMIQALQQKPIDFNTFYAKVKIDYADNSNGGQATAFIRIKKDSIIWISLNQLGIEGMRLLIRPDSVFLMNKLNRSLQMRSIRYLQELTELPVNFTELQDLIIGNPIFLDSHVSQYRNSDETVEILMAGPIFKHLITLQKPENLFVHSKFDDVSISRNRTCDITLDKYERQAGFPFSTLRKIAVSEERRLDLEMDFKNYNFNQPLSFPFSVPSNYQRK